MFETMIHFRAFIAVAVALALTAIASADPMSAGLTRLSLDTSVNEKIDVAIWYPTTTPAREQSLGPFKVTVALDAPFSSTESTARPLILVSHGTGGNNLTHQEVTIPRQSRGLSCCEPLKAAKRGRLRGPNFGCHLAGGGLLP